MDRRHPAFDWNRARAFLTTAEEGSFSAAARVLGQAQPTLGRQVAALEEELGVVLFERVGTSLVLTATGLELVEALRPMSEAASRASLIAAGQSQSLEGTVRISASQAVTAYLLPPIIATLRGLHPGIEVDLVVANEVSDLRRREADIAVRHFRPEGDDLIARLVRETSEAHIYGTPKYLRSIGNPKTVDELAARGEIFGFDDTPTLLAGLRSQGYAFSEQSFPIRAGDHLVQWELAKQGLGMCVMMEEVGDRERGMRRALKDSPPVVTLPTWLTCHRELKTSLRLRVVFDLLAEALAGL